jgi:hypothetical protein
MVLEETIDRVRFEMDELRTTAGRKSQSSREATMSRSLEAEMEWTTADKWEEEGSETSRRRRRCPRSRRPRGAAVRTRRRSRQSSRRRK